MMEAVHTSETSVYSNESTWRYSPEGSNLPVKVLSTHQQTFTNNGVGVPRKNTYSTNHMA
jgi:hypothetical protein